jgi:hypothetical protein
VLGRKDASKMLSRPSRLKWRNLRPVKD